MSSGFRDSLLAAIANVIDDLEPTVTPQTQPEPPTWSDSLERLADKPVTFDVPKHQGIQGIREADPNFKLDEFLVHVGEMFSAYHVALDRGELAPVRRFIDEGYYPAVEKAAKAHGPSPEGPRPLTVRAIRPATAKHEEGLDLVRVSISATQGGIDPRTICEYWELIRKRGTLTKPGLSITRCPNCGGPVDGDDPTRCAYCDTRLADPALDWVVRKITAQ